MTRLTSFGGIKLRTAGLTAGTALFLFCLIYSAIAAVSGLCWQYAINTWLEWADKSENAISFGSAFLIGLIPWINGVGLVVFGLTFVASFIVPLFL